MARISKEFKETLSDIHLMQMNKTHVFVVDVVNGFIKKGEMADNGIAPIIPRIRELLSFCTTNSTFICEAHSQHDVEFNTFPPHCIEGTYEAEIVDELQDVIMNESEEPCFNIVTKSSTNGFHEFSTKHKDRMLRLIDDNHTFVITGCCTDICVMQFALSFKTYLNEINKDRRVVVVSSCVDTYDIPGDICSFVTPDDVHNAIEYNEIALKLMRNAGIEIYDDFHLGSQIK